MRKLLIVSKGGVQQSLATANQLNIGEVANGIPPRYEQIVDGNRLPALVLESATRPRTLLQVLYGSDINAGNISLATDFPPELPEPPRSTHISTLVSVDATKSRPAKVKRVWQGNDYFFDCLATQSVRDEYRAGKIQVGDYLIVHFDEIGEQVVTAKVFKSW